MAQFERHDAPDLAEGSEATAIVKWFNAAKGFGFVTPEDGSPDAFLHISALNRAGLQHIEEGAGLRCMIAPGPRGPQVTRVVEVLAGAKPRASAVERVRPPGAETEVSGTVKWFKGDKGFGFVEADDGGKDVFVHKSMLRRCNLLLLNEGQRVHMRVHESAKGREAAWLMVL